MTDRVQEDDPVARLVTALEARHPHVMVPDLSRMTDLMDVLGSPQRAFPSLHLTGTNGKTSTARMIDALLRAHQLRTGRYTSPHLISVTERIALDGAPISPERLAQVWDEIAPYVGMVDARHAEQMTFFEVGTALAFAAFADNPVDVGVVEVGLGGTWDATNVIEAPVAVLTTIDLDHTELLGDSVGEIATEKAGIIHAGAVAVVARQQDGALEAIAVRAAEVGATLLLEGRDLAVLDRRVALGGQLLSLETPAGTYPELLLPLHGAHQGHNALLALAAVEAFLGGRALDLDVVREGFAAADSPGRLEVLRRSPTVVLDGAHNPAGARALAEAIDEAFTFHRLVAVVGVLADKDAVSMLEALSTVVDHVVATTADSPRALPAEDLGALAADILGPEAVTVVEGLADAIDAAVTLADEGLDAEQDPGGIGVQITGSLVTVGEARRLLLSR